MKKRAIALIIFAVILLLFMIYFFQKQNFFLSKNSNEDIGNYTSAQMVQDNFSIIFRYNYYNELDTLNKIYTKDMVTGDNVVINFSLSDEEMKKIQEKVDSMNFFEIPVFNGPNGPFFVKENNNSYGSTEGCQYYFRVQESQKVKEFTWIHTCADSSDNLNENNLIELSKLILGYIESKEDYKSLPPARGGYL